MLGKFQSKELVSVTLSLALYEAKFGWNKVLVGVGIASASRIGGTQKTWQWATLFPDDGLDRIGHPAMVQGKKT